MVAEEDEYEYEDEYEDEEPADAGHPGHAESAGSDANGHEHRGLRFGGLSLGFVAVLPMLVAYELALQRHGGGWRNTSELLLFRVFGPLGEHAHLARWIAILGVTVAALVVCYRRRLALVPGVLRVIAEGGIGALLLYREGYKITSLSDMYGSVYNEGGLDVPQVLDYLQEHRRLEGYAEADHLPNSEQLYLDCDVLVPAATENQITSRNADQIKARLIVEGANGPTTAAAQEILDDRGIVVVPDILANAGGVTVSYFEWVQDRMGYFWTEEIVNSRLEQIMVESFREVAETARKFKVPLRTGAYILAIDRVATVYRLRGLFA